MKNKILVVYQFATFGGVERVLLNRAEAFKYYGINSKMFLYFYVDYGAKDSLKEYIKKRDLEDYLEIVDNFDVKNYDYVVSIDTPQIFEDNKISPEDAIIETHTFERKCRTYLDAYLDKAKKILVPAQSFKKQLEKEYNQNLDEKVEVLNNFVPWDIESDKYNDSIHFPEWNKQILFYFGRMDENKNTKELLRGVKYYIENYGDDVILLLIGKMDPLYHISEYIDEEGLSPNVVALPPVAFDKIGLLLKSLYERKAIFVSTSKGESFGLSAAEALSHDIPSILSYIDAHESLLKGNSKLLYELGDIKGFAEKIDFVIHNYKKVCEDIESYKESFSAKNFVSEWKKIFERKN